MAYNTDCCYCLESLDRTVSNDRGEVIAVPTTVLKCGHAFCSECFAEAIAKNVGTFDGNTRNQCALCLTPFCSPIETDAHTAVVLEQYELEIERLESTVEDQRVKLKQQAFILKVRGEHLRRKDDAINSLAQIHELMILNLSASGQVKDSGELRRLLRTVQEWCGESMDDDDSTEVESISVSLLRKRAATVIQCLMRRRRLRNRLQHRRRSGWTRDQWSTFNAASIAGPSFRDLLLRPDLDESEDSDMDTGEDSYNYSFPDSDDEQLVVHGYDDDVGQVVDGYIRMREWRAGQSPFDDGHG